MFFFPSNLYNAQFSCDEYRIETGSSNSVNISRRSCLAPGMYRPDDLPTLLPPPRIPEVPSTTHTVTHTVMVTLNLRVTIIVGLG